MVAIVPFFQGTVRVASKLEAMSELDFSSIGEVRICMSPEPQAGSLGLPLPA